MLSIVIKCQGTFLNTKIGNVRRYVAFSCILGIRLISCESLSPNTGPSLLAPSVNICFVGFIEPKKEMVSGCEI